MKVNIIITLLFAFNIVSNAQDRTSYQSDSVMKSNHIKTKISYPERTVSKAKEIYNFDREGRLVEYILTDNGEEDKLQFKMCYFYNSENKVIKIIDSSYSEPSVEITEYVYQPNGDYYAKSYNIKNKKRILSDITYSADSSRESHKFYNDKEVRRENISYYERPNYSYKFAGSKKNNDGTQTYVINGKTYTIVDQDKWEYFFKNEYDAEGRIVERARVVKNVTQDKCIFTYDANGLLLDITTVYYYNGKESRSKELFTYIKWD